MKKTVFLILSAVAILLSGCTGSSYELINTTGIGNAIINTNPPSPSERDEDPNGVCLSLSPRSSLNIDINCIIHYVRGDSTFGPDDERLGDMNSPWISWNISF